MKEFDELCGVMDRLIGPGGCPWDQEQTLQSIRHNAIEEAYELVEAINLNDPEKICEEIGDVIFVAIFFANLARKEGMGNLEHCLRLASEKLIRRHPHVFGEGKINGSDEVLKQWEEIKKTEKGREKHKSALDGLTQGLPALIRAQKVLKKLKKAHFDTTEVIPNDDSIENRLLTLVNEANDSHINLEVTLLEATTKLETAFRKQEDVIKQ